MQRELGPLRLFTTRTVGKRLTAVASFKLEGRPRGLHLGLTAHRWGGVSLIGLPRRGGTTVSWGAIRERMERHACDCIRVPLGPVSIHIGQDF